MIPFSELRNDVLDRKIKDAVAAYKALSPEEKARHDYEQRRSFVRGMCPSRMNYDEWCALVDKQLPPLK